MSDLRKVTSSKSVAVVECKLIGSNGQVRDLTSPLIYNNIQIYESIFSPVITGTIQLIEGTNLSGMLSMHGNEYLFISFCRPGEDTQESRYTRTFRIFKCDTRKPSGNSQVQTYVLHFCSDELIFSNQQTISRSFSGKSTGEYIYSILTHDLKINKNRIRTIEKSQGVQDHVLTKYKPFEAIEFFTKRSFNENESPFVFFENRDGYNFVSLEKLFQQNPIDPPLSYSGARLTYEQTDSPFKNAHEIKDFEFEQAFNILEGTENAAYATRLFTLDLIRQKYKRYDYSAKNKFSQRTLLDGFFPLNDARNRNEKTVYEEFNAQPNYWLTNFGQNDTAWVRSRVRRIEGKPQPITITNTDIEKFLMQRKVHLNLLDNTRLWCIMPGNPNYSVGYTIVFNMPSFIPNTKVERALDPHLAGKYLITAIRHSIIPDDIETVLYFNKNSVSSPLDAPDIGNTAYKKAREF